jgi:hypothetical protein
MNKVISAELFEARLELSCCHSEDGIFQSLFFGSDCDTVQYPV